MKPVFADTSFYQALLNPRDRWHIVAHNFAASFDGKVVTSEYVLFELGALMSRGALRTHFVAMLRDLETDPQTDIVSASPGLFADAVSLFTRRPDKEWSLADCASFSIMQRQSMTDALSSDHHFEQAGYRRLLQA